MTSIRPVRRLAPNQYQWARDNGYTDDELRAEGFELPERADFSGVVSGGSTTAAPQQPSFLSRLARKFGAAGRGAIESAALNFSDEGAGALAFHRDEDAPLMAQLREGSEPGGTFDERYQRAKASREQAQRDQPGAYLTGQIAGAFAPGIGAGIAPVRAARAGKLAAAARSATGAGAITGGVASVGAAEGSLPHRLPAAVPGALIGGAAGATLGGAATLVSKGAQKMGPKMQRLAAKLPSRQPKALPAAMPKERETALRLIAQKFADSGMSPDEVSDAIARIKAGDPELLLNVGGDPVQALARVVQSLPGRSKQVVSDALEEQAVAIPELISRGLDDALGKPVPNVVARQQELTDAAAAAAKPAYEAIRKQFVQAPGLDRVLKRPAIEDALALARRNILNRGDAVPDGLTVGLADDVKKILDDQIESIEEAITKGMARGADKSAVQSLRSARQALVDAVDEATAGAYADARGIAQQGIRSREAFREGTGALRQKGDVLRSTVQQMTPEEQALALEGAATDVTERLTARDPGRAASVFDAKTRRNLDILAEQLPKQKEKIAGTYERARKIQEQAKRSTMYGQSTTQATAAGQRELEGAVGEVFDAFDPGGALTFGVKPSMVRILANRLRDAVERKRMGVTQDVAGEIADILTKKLGDPVSQSDVLRLLNQAMSEQAVRAATKAGRKLTAGATAGAATGGRRP